MRRGPEALNRTFLSLIGLILLAAGLAGLLVSFGAFGERLSREPVLRPGLRYAVTHNGRWIWPLAFVVSLIVAYLGLRWLLSQLQASRPGNADLERRSSRGYTVVRANGAASALEADLESQRGVQGASARMVGAGNEAELDLRVEVSEEADLGQVRQRIEQFVLPRFRQAIEVDRVPTHLRLALRPEHERRVS